MSFSTVIEILVVNRKTGNSKKDGKPFDIPEPHCVLRDDSGNATAVGVLQVSKDLAPLLQPGLFTGTFGLQASTFGDNQGRITAVLTGLTPIKREMLRPTPPKL